MVLVVILVVIGYFFNDMIVVFDWVCENFCRDWGVIFVEIINNLFN